MTKQEFIDAVLREFPREIGGLPTHFLGKGKSAQDVVVLHFSWFEAGKQVSASVATSGREIEAGGPDLVTRQIKRVLDRIEGYPLFQREQMAPSGAAG